LFCGLLLVAVSCSHQSGAAGDQQQLAEQGRHLYQVYCVNCHGENGRGDGPTARYLKVEPADLTRLSKRNDGEFPGEATDQAIDGRRGVPGHGRSQMPIWGLSLQLLNQDTNQEDEVRQKILQLVEYLRSIQR